MRSLMKSKSNNKISENANASRFRLSNSENGSILKITNSYLFKPISFVGLDGIPGISRRRRVINILFHAFILIVAIETGINFALMDITKNTTSKLTFLALMSNVLTAISWFMLLYKSKDLRRLTRRIQNDCPSSTKRKMENLCLWYVCTTPILYSIFMLILVLSHPGPYYMYNYAIQNIYLKGMSSFISSFLSTFLYPTLSNLISLIFCSVCLRCCEYTRRLTFQIEICPPENFDLQTQVDLLKKQSRMEDAILRRFQNVYSSPSFLVYVAQFCACGNLLGWVVTSTDRFNDVVSMSSVVFYAVNSVGSLSASLWIAGGIAIEMKKFRDAFGEKTHKRRLMLVPYSNEASFEEGLNRMANFALSGCDILYYRRSSILTVVGAILTYTLLLLNTK